ncbi:hypothetical protein GGI25_004683 [Coemansia spiralis]|uniref:Uncharacterized protein n=2 Tax=Coemansia TaxID=4863 RepID=A0A9W8G4P1_9FUNG|nr:hypothetical protein BX070DRAFT_235746 [Coemansia spiralis]KAJ1987994.1 hypothetical protein EDC05_005548 [Coemansia umbellata]KAJ2620561.1 hypothetical protein GGI26_004903 [Coemansia sp. RSA 1358]KAJ2673582.1 hypothetical protein GGI25_004683 [Coemansia spiralis]
MRVILLSLLAASALALPAIVRRDEVNGAVALSNPDINNGAKDEGVLKNSVSLEGALIDHPTDNTLTDINTNLNFHDNAVLNPTVNAAVNTEGGAVVGDNNQIIPLHSGGGVWLRRKRQVNAPAAVDNPVVNSGAMREGSLDAGLSADGARFVNPVGNSVAQANTNEEVSGNNFENPEWNAIDNNQGPAMAGDDNTLVQVNNMPDAIHIDNGALMDAALAAGGFAPLV